MREKSQGKLGDDPVKYAGGTDIGLKRSVNEDDWIAAEFPKTDSETGGSAMVFAVADGLGGHSGGDVASKLACEGVLSFHRRQRRFPEDIARSPGSVGERLSALLRKIDREIREKSRTDVALEDMATTLSVLATTKETAVVAHVGDSRIYRLRNGRLSRLTPDHNFVQEMIDEGEIAPEDAETHPLRNMLTSVLGTDDPLETLFVDAFPLEPGDRFLLCSDGLSDMVPDDTIAELLESKSDPERIVAKLIEKALANGGKDNVTVVVVQTPGLFESG